MRISDTDLSISFQTESFNTENIQKRKKIGHFQKQKIMDFDAAANTNALENMTMPRDI